MPRPFPFPLPNGWFQLAWSDELAAGAVLPLRYFARDLVLFRTQAGDARVLDAFCPHLGAHLGYGGRVVGDTIQCPFHAWRFDGSGACIEVPYAKKIPARAQVASLPVCEANGMVFAWHHAEAKPPEWAVPVVAEVGDPAWTPYRRHRWTIRTRNQEMAENAVDRAHFRYVHGTKNVPESEVTTEGHCLRSVQRAKMMTPRGMVEGRIESNSFGFGCSVIRFTGICETVLFGSTTPIDLEHVDVRFSFTVKREHGNDTERGVGGAIIADIVKQMGEDIPIWENKVFRPRPVLCEGDGPIGLFRRWCLQFYSEVAPAYRP
jgi:phenylpropionate dioxygenase-like ring-hydroxylating dioxygenase large terminal subunit